MTISLGAVVTIDPCAGLVRMSAACAWAAPAGKANRPKSPTTTPTNNAAMRARRGRRSRRGRANRSGAAGSGSSNGTLMTTILADRSQTDHTRAPHALKRG